jgi:hypothetical protein
MQSQRSNVEHFRPKDAYNPIPERLPRIACPGPHARQARPRQNLQHDEKLNGVGRRGSGRVQNGDYEKSSRKHGNAVAQHVRLGEQEVFRNPDSEGLGVHAYADSEAVDIAVSGEAALPLRFQ